MTVYSSSTSLILTDLLTRGQNYSFAVAVTDSTGQHGPWSDQLMVTYDGKIIYLKHFMLFLNNNKVPGSVVNISWIELNQTAISTNWKVSIVMYGQLFLYSIL